MKPSTILVSILFSIVAFAGSARADGETCGGVTNLSCPSGEVCVGGGPGDQTGTCMTDHRGCDASGPGAGSAAPAALGLVGATLFFATRRRRRA